MRKKNDFQKRVGKLFFLLIFTVVNVEWNFIVEKFFRSLTGTQCDGRFDLTFDKIP